MNKGNKEAPVLKIGGQWEKPYYKSNSHRDDSTPRDTTCPLRSHKDHTRLLVSCVVRTVKDTNRALEEKWEKTRGRERVCKCRHQDFEEPESGEMGEFFY